MTAWLFTLAAWTLVAMGAFAMLALQVAGRDWLRAILWAVTWLLAVGWLLDTMAGSPRRKARK
jgi:hypothetical protein